MATGKHARVGALSLGPAPRRARAGIRNVALCGGIALGLAGGLTTASGFTATPQLQQAVVVAKPSLVHLILDVAGTLHDNTDGRVHGPFHDTLSGSGWFVDQGGDIVTAAHVAAPTADEIKQTLALRYINTALCSSAADCAAVTRNRLPQIVASSTAQDVKVGLRVLTQDISLPSGSTAADAYNLGVDASVVASSPSTSRDLALVHISSHDDPVVLVRQSATSTGMQAAIIGFPPAATFSVPPSFTYGSVIDFGHGSGRFGLPAEPSAIGLAADANIVGIDAYAEHGVSGGPGVDDAGNVVGVVSFGADPAGPVRAAFLISAGDITSFLAKAGVVNGLGPADTAWRAGLASLNRGETAPALEQFRVCAARSPLNVGCRSMLAVATGRVADTGGHTGTVVLLLVAGAGVAGIGAGLVIWRRKRRERRRRLLFRA